MVSSNAAGGKDQNKWTDVSDILDIIRSTFWNWLLCGE